MTDARNILTVNEKFKSIPYPAANNEDSQNFGFRVLKGKPEKVDRVLEASDLPALASILKTINRSGSPFFSVGCEKAFNVRNGDHWAKGYVEFAYNYEGLVSDATQYFPLFFQFNKSAAEFLKQNDVQFWWDLQPAHFKAIDETGFSCCVWITTGFYATSLDAKKLFEKSLELLEAFLDGFDEPENLRSIYDRG